MTSSAPAEIPSHDAAPVHVPPAGMTTTLASPPGSSGRENTAPFEGAAGGVASRRQFGPGGTLTATRSGPHRIPSPFRQPGPVLGSEGMMSCRTPDPSRFARPMVPPWHAGGVHPNWSLTQYRCSKSTATP